MADILGSNVTAAARDSGQSADIAMTEGFFEWLESRSGCFPLLVQIIRALFGIIFSLKDEIAGLLEKISGLEEENRNLNEQAHLGSDTSGIPPSKDWRQNGVSKESANTVDANDAQMDECRRETPTSVTEYLKNRSGEKRLPGGQKNHPPAFMHIADAQDREPVLHYPNSCARCPNFERCKKEGRFRKYSTAHGYDIEIVRVHREHWMFEVTDCLQDGSMIHEDFTEVTGAQYYEANIQLHVLTWHHVFHGSYDRIGLAAKELFGLSLSAGTANSIVKSASAAILGSGFMDASRFYILLFERVLGVDETSACVYGRNAWVHTEVTSNITLLTAHWRRGYEGAIYPGVLQFYTHTLISDCFAVYFNENIKCRHAICNSHILRELVAAAYFRQQSWAIRMFDLLLEILTAKRDAVERSEKELPQAYLGDIRARYRQIVADGFSENAGVTKGKTVALLKRLCELEDSALAFAVDFRVDFTNNASEQSLRNLKVALRVIGQFRTMSGLADYCIIQSFVDTCRKQGRNPIDMMRIALSGGDIIEAVFGAERAAPLKQMIQLTDAIAAGDGDGINEMIAGMTIKPSEELLAAASYGRLRICDQPPPEKKNSTSAVPKDKMQAAREIDNLKNTLQTSTAPPSASPQDSEMVGQEIKAKRTRAAPKCA